MKVRMVTGGARSGKSRYAVERARELGGSEVTFVATARTGGNGEADPEMERRIEGHRAERPDGWETIEPPVPAGEAVREARHPVVLLDCLTLLVSDAVHGAPQSEEEALRRAEERVSALLEAARRREGCLILVTNEVGLGVVPPGPRGRWFRDALGRANQRAAAEADRVTLLVSGLPLVLKPREGGG